MSDILKHVFLPELLSTEFPQRELIVAPWLRVGGLALIYAPTGHGKTLIMTNLALSIASGQRFLDQTVPKPRKVLYVDGEMPIDMVQERLRKMLVGQRWNDCVNANFALLSHEFMERGIPPLGDPEDARGRKLIDRHIADFDVLFLDNVSSLMGYGIENDAESWSATNEWLLNLRRRGRAVILVHHAGKADSRGRYAQRGTSRRVDQLDTMVQLVMTETEPLTIHWKFEKHRSFLPKPPEGFDINAEFTKDAAGRETACRLRLGDDPLAEVDDYLNSGHSIRETAKLAGKSRSVVGRRAKERKDDSADC